MRFISFFALLLSACSNEPEAARLAPGLFAGEGHDALCISGEEPDQRAGFIAYGDSDNNCSARGRVKNDGLTWALVPAGEGDCKIPFSVNGDKLSLGPGHPSCSYYCGPGATFDGKSFHRVSPGDAVTAQRNPMVDFAGEPLC